MAKNFHRADMIRMTEKSNRQMRFFHDKLKIASKVDEKMERVRSLTKEISELSDQVQSLSKKEMEQIDSLNSSINEHRRVQKSLQGADFDIESLKKSQS